MPSPRDATKLNVWYREILATLLGWLATGGLQPIVGQRFPLGGRAGTRADGGGPVPGKIVLVAA